MRRISNLGTLAPMLLILAAGAAGAVSATPGPPSDAPPPGQELPPGHPAIATPSSPAEALPPLPPDAGTGSAGLHWTVPEEWAEQPPSSPMRRAQYRLPGDDERAQCIVYYFGPGQGGDARTNAERWANQLTQPDGRSSLDVAQVAELAVGEITVTTIAVTGSYDGGMVPGGQQSAPISEAMLLGAIASGPDANWFFKCTGPRSVVEPEKAAFEDMIRSLRPGTGSGAGG